MPYGQKKKKSKGSWAERFRASFNKSSVEKEKERSQDLYLKKLQQRKKKKSGY